MAAFLVVFGLLFALMAAAYTYARRHYERVSVYRILLFAVLFRLVFVFVGLPPENRFEALARDLGGVEPGYRTFLMYDNDAWRYLWDGHLTVTGLGPYAHTPEEWRELVEASPSEGPPLESELWWEVFDNLSFTNYTSVYPPLAQELFAFAYLLVPGSVLALKLLIVLIDLVCCLAVAALLKALDRPRYELILYAWNPLVIKEFAGSGHVDVLMMLALTLAVVSVVRRRDAFAQLLLGIAIAAKLGALLLVPLICRRTRPSTWLLAPLSAILVSLPFLGGLAGLGRGLSTYAREWDFNSGPWVALHQLLSSLGLDSPALWAHGLTKGVVIGAVLWTLRPGPFDPQRFNRDVFVTLALLVVLNPAVMPWYLPWALPFAVAAGARSWILLTALAMLSYLFYVDQGAASWWLWVEYLLFVAAVGWEWRRDRSKIWLPSPSATLTP